MGEIIWFVRIVIVGVVVRAKRSVGASASSKLHEFHLIAGEGARLVGEDVFDLAQFFVQVGPLHFSINPITVVDHLRCPLDKKALVDLDHINSHQQRYWHEIGENEDPSPRKCQNLLPERHLLIFVLSVVEVVSVPAHLFCVVHHGADHGRC